MHYVYVPMVLNALWDESVIIIVAMTIIKLKKMMVHFIINKIPQKKTNILFFRDNCLYSDLPPGEPCVQDGPAASPRGLGE